MKISIHSILTTVFLSLVSVCVQAQDCVSLYFEASEDTGVQVVQLKVNNFDNILITQFAMAYSYENLELISVQGNADIELLSSHINSQVPGYITVSWSQPSIGQTLPDGSVLIEMRFTETVNDVSEFSIDPNFNTEIIDGGFDEVCFEATALAINESRTQLVGNLYHDLNNNCIEDPTDLPLAGWTVLIDGDIEKFYRVTDAFGHYSVPVEIGEYTIQVIEPSDLWSSCEGLVVETVLNSGEILENSFVLSPVNSSSALDVVISSSEVKRCFDNTYSVKYRNNGTAIAQSATIEILLDENLDYVSSNTAGVSSDGQVITIDIGNVKPGEGGDFQVFLNANCDKVERGQTLCVEANISSTDIVIPPIDWGGAVLTTKATCEEDSVVFTVQNIGASAMAIPLQSIVVEDDIIFGTNEVDLEPLELMQFKHAASGGVYRVLVDQEDGYPLGNYATDFIEFCNGGDNETYQYVSMFQNEDESPYRDIQCQKVIDVEDTNNMSAFPIGYREEHFINQNEDIEYTIHFQNLGTDTVNNLTIGNLIDENLDMKSLVAGSSSHAYTLSIKEERRLKIDFKNIQLPSADTSEMESKGFIKFRISQNKDVPIGTKINSASIIFFDLEDGIETNEVTHTVGEEFIEIVLSDEDLLLDSELMIAPNPAVSSIRVELPEQYKDLSYVLYDTKGSIVNAANTPSNVFYIYRDFIQKGMYFLEIRSSTKILGTKKIVFQD